MSDPLTIMAAAAAALAVLTFLLSRVVPDDYDSGGPRRVESRRSDKS